MKPYVPHQAQNQADLDAGVAHYLNSNGPIGAHTYGEAYQLALGYHVKLTEAQYQALLQLIASQPQGAEDPFVMYVSNARTGETEAHVTMEEWRSYQRLLASLPHLAVHPLPIALHSGALLAGSGSLGADAPHPGKLTAEWKIGIGAAVAAGLAFFL